MQLIASYSYAIRLTWSAINSQEKHTSPALPEPLTLLMLKLFPYALGDFLGYLEVSNSLKVTGNVISW